MADTTFHGEFSSADASALSEANSRVTLYSVGTAVAVPTLAATDVVVITDILVRVGAAITVNLYDGPNNVVDAGEKIFSGAFAANTGQDQARISPHFCQAGTYPKVKGSAAGQVDVLIHGYVRTLA